MIYFTADLHFGHTNVITFCQRPFASSQEMDTALQENWNATVQPADTIYILGDISLRGPEYINALLPRLHGKKHLIYGNHDLFRRKESFMDNADKGIFRFDVGVDANAYCPVSLHTIMTWASHAPCAAVDHHYRE